MSIRLTLRIPSPIIDELSKIETDEDKTRTQVILQLIEEAIELRRFRRGEKTDEIKERMDTLKDKCTTEILLQMAGHISEIARYTFDNNKSKFQSVKSPDDLRECINDNVTSYINGFLNKS